MPDPDTGRLDIRQMRLLLTVLTECNVSRTAQLLDQPQPTVSLSLRRLRAIFADPLLVRDGNGLVPTERGLELRGWLRRVLPDIDAQLDPRLPFDPGRQHHHFKLMSANCFGATFLPRIIGRIREAAPASTIDISPMLRFDAVLPLMATGGADLILGNWPRSPDHLRMSRLFSSDIVCLVHGRHPFSALERLTVERYIEADHLSLTPTDIASLSPIDARLAELGLVRRIAVSVPEYSAVPYILAQTDLAFTTSRSFAEHLAGLMPLSVIEMPKAFGTIVFNMLWHERGHRAPAHRWLRTLVRSVAQEFEVSIGADERAAPIDLQSLGGRKAAV